MTAPYVPQVGHLVKVAGFGDVLLCASVDGGLAILVTQNGGQLIVDTDSNMRPLADRSAEWEALFQLPIQPTP